jgi:hypothetical protein
MDDYRYKALQNLTRARYYAVQNLVREKNRFTNYLFMKCCGLMQDKAFSDNFGAAALATFEEFETPDDRVAVRFAYRFRRKRRKAQRSATAPFPSKPPAFRV